MASHLESPPDVPREPLLHHDVPPQRVLEPGSLNCLLHVHPVFQHVHEHLRCRLEDAESPRGANAELKLVVLECLRRRDDEVHALPRTNLVRTALVQLEVRPHVVQEHSRVPCDHAGAEPAAEGLRDAHHVAVPVGHGEVSRHPALELHRVARPERIVRRGVCVTFAAHVGCRRHVDAPPLCCRVPVREQPGERSRHVIRVARPLDAVRDCQLDRFHEPVEGIDRLIARVGTLHHLERLKHLEPAGVRRRRIDAVAVVLDADRVLPLDLVVGQVVHREQPVHLLAGLHDALGDLAAIEDVRALLGNELQRAGKVRPNEASTGWMRRSRPVENGLGRLGKLAQVFRRLVHDLAIDIGNREPILGIADGLLEQALAVHRPVGLVEREPSGQVPWNQRGQYSLFEILHREPVGSRRSRHPSREVQRPHAPLGGHVRQREPYSSHARHIRLDDVQG